MKTHKSLWPYPKKVIARKLVDEGVTAQFLANLLFNYPSSWLVKQRKDKKKAPIYKKAATNKHRTKSEVLDRSMLWVRNFPADTTFRSEKRINGNTVLTGPSLIAFNIIREFYSPVADAKKAA